MKAQANFQYGINATFLTLDENLFFFVFFRVKAVLFLVHFEDVISEFSPSFHLRSWLNRRQIDGSLNRTPLGFYDRVWQILERTPNGIVVAGTHLPQVRTSLYKTTKFCA